MSKVELTELDRRMIDIATKNWQQFVALVGPDAILRAKICLLRKQNLSYGQIQAKLNVTKDQVRYQCEKCGD